MLRPDDDHPHPRPENSTESHTRAADFKGEMDPQARHVMLPLDYSLQLPSPFDWVIHHLCPEEFFDYNG